MGTVVFIVLISMILTILVLLFILFSSAYYLRLRLSWNKESLEKLPSTTEVNDLILKINKISDKKDVSKVEKKEMRTLISDSTKVLTKCVPCYYERGDIPDSLARIADDSKCRICNETSCVFHVWHAYLPTEWGWLFFNLKFQPNH